LFFLWPDDHDERYLHSLVYALQDEFSDRSVSARNFNATQLVPTMSNKVNPTERVSIYCG